MQLSTPLARSRQKSGGCGNCGEDGSLCQNEREREGVFSLCRNGCQREEEQLSTEKNTSFINSPPPRIETVANERSPPPSVEIGAIGQQEALRGKEQRLPPLVNNLIVVSMDNFIYKNVPYPPSLMSSHITLFFSFIVVVVVNIYTRTMSRTDREL